MAGRVATEAVEKLIDATPVPLEGIDGMLKLPLRREVYHREACPSAAQIQPSICAVA